jgi:hypothetical protein
MPLFMGQYLLFPQSGGPLKWGISGAFCRPLVHEANRDQGKP